MADYLAIPIKDFVASTAAKIPTPGGGSVAASCGALGAMEHSVGIKACAAVYEMLGERLK